MVFKRIKWLDTIINYRTLNAYDCKHSRHDLLGCLAGPPLGSHKDKAQVILDVNRCGRRLPAGLFMPTQHTYYTGFCVIRTSVEVLFFHTSVNVSCKPTI